MRKRSIAMVAGLVAISLGGYAAADAYDTVPGFLTMRPAPADPVPYPHVSAPAAKGFSFPEPTEFTSAHALQERAEQFARSLPGLGISVRIEDVPSGTKLADVDSDQARSTASSVKILPAAAALLALGPDHPISTSVTLSDSTLTIVGRGDMLLTGRILEKLASDVHESLESQGMKTINLAVDDTAFSGPVFSSGWSDLDHPWIQPVAAIAVNSGKSDGKSADEDPAMAAGDMFAKALKKTGTKVDRLVRAKSPEDAVVVASYDGTSISDLIAHTLKTSDNTTSEATARLVALARGEEGTFDAGRKAVAAELSDAGFDLTSANLADSCGLDSATKVPAALLTAIVRASASGENEALAPLVSSLPVAHLDGTLKGRLEKAPGLVRAKTGTLVSVVSLSGIVEGPANQELAFSILIDRAESGSFMKLRKAVDAFVVSLTSELP